MAQRSHRGLEEADHVWMTDYCSPSISCRRSPPLLSSRPPASVQTARRQQEEEGQRGEEGREAS